MSTKIYNGIKFKSSNIREVLDQLISLKKVANDKALEILKDSEIALFVATNKISLDDPFEATRELLHAINSKTHTLNHKYTFIPNLYFSIIVYPDKDGDIYGYYFDSNVESFRELLKPLYDDFHYQNQSDPPSYLSEEEWNFRRTKWDELVDYNFSDSGFTYDLVTGDTIDLWKLESRVSVVLDKLKRDRIIDQALN